MKSNILTLMLISGITSTLISCNNTNNGNATPQNPDKTVINIDLGDDAPTIDPAMTQDTNSARVIYDLFEGLVTFNQANQPIPGLAESWFITNEGKTYTFKLRDNLHFSDGSPLSASDVVFSWQRLADPKVASPYNFLVSNLVNGQAIIDGKAPATSLGIKALNSHTIEINLTHADSSFLQICTMPNTATVSQANVRKFPSTWTDPKNMITSGAYTLKEWVIRGHMTLTKNPHYYDESNVTINTVNFLPLVDTNSSLSQYRTGEVDITWSVPTDQYKKILREFGTQVHTVTQEGIYYYDLNMTLGKFADNKNLRQALSMAINREVLAKEILGRGQQPLYTYVTPTVEESQFANLDYSWANLSYSAKLAEAKKLFAEAGYGPKHPLQLNIAYNTNDGHKKVALAIASMWQQAFGSDSITVSQNNQEWKTFLKARNMANYDVARDAWVADYDSVDSYTNLYYCQSPQNNSKYCNPQFNQLIDQAKATNDSAKRIQLIRTALQIAQEDYAIIPIYQYTYTHLINPRVKNYTPETNHLDHVQSKWYKFN